MQDDFGPGLHTTVGRPVDAVAYAAYIGRWSRLFVPAVLAAAEVAGGYRLLDVATGPGEVASVAMSVRDGAGLVVGADVSPAMLEAARARIGRGSFLGSFQPVATDGQALAFGDRTFDAVVCHLGLQFFADPMRGVSEFRRVLRPGRCAAVCVVSTPDKAPMWGVLADAVSRHRPDRRAALHLSFSLADAERLERLFATAGFRDVRVEREVRQGTVGSFDEYWAPIEAGTGQIPQAYLALPAASRRVVREEVQARLMAFDSGGRLRMEVEMLIAAGRA
jgi:ubiquinone/menaquinone biosynthesis C-methylase UbiE